MQVLIGARKEGTVVDYVAYAEYVSLSARGVAFSRACAMGVKQKFDGHWVANICHRRSGSLPGRISE